VPPVDVSTLGSGSGVLPSPAAFVPPDWDKDPFVQGVGGFLGGLCLGAVPFAGVGQQFLDAAEVLPHGTPEARLGLAIGEIVGGALTTATGVVATLGGGAVSLTGLGALVGVPVVVGSATAVVGGLGNMAAGVRGLMTSGAGSGQQVATAEPKGGTYQLKDPKTGQVMRNGRTNDLVRRRQEHANDPATRDLIFDELNKTDDYAVQRGLEQLQIDTERGPMDKVNGIDPRNPNRDAYLDAARRFKENRK
jgi:hypothetical protein